MPKHAESEHENLSRPDALSRRDGMSPVKSYGIEPSSIRITTSMPRSSRALDTFLTRASTLPAKGRGEITARLRVGVDPDAPFRD
jgi:hypothetical protein